MIDHPFREVSALRRSDAHDVSGIAQRAQHIEDTRVNRAVIDRDGGILRAINGEALIHPRVVVLGEQLRN